MTNELANALGATSTTEDVLAGVNPRGKRILTREFRAALRTLHLAPPNNSTLSNGLADQGRKRFSVNLVF